MPKYREHFKESSTQVIHYHLYQPLVLKIAPWLVKRGVTPNQISIARLIVILTLTWFLYSIRNRPLTITQKIIICISVCVILLLCGLSDDLDGYIARKYNMYTKYGKQIDGSADITANICMMFIIAVYTKKPIIIVLMALLFFYANVWDREKNPENCKDKCGTPALFNIFSHGWLAAGLVISLLIIFKNPTSP